VETKTAKRKERMETLLNYIKQQGEIEYYQLMAKYSWESGLSTVTIADYLSALKAAGLIKIEYRDGRYMVKPA
jgi:DeoR/GlpR family transcriptional regulator of sugar metabolism